MPSKRISIDIKFEENVWQLKMRKMMKEVFKKLLNFYMATVKARILSLESCETTPIYEGFLKNIFV